MKYHIVALYKLKNQLLSKGHSTEGPKIPFISNLKKPTCASKRDVLELEILRYVHSIISCYSGPHGRVNVMLVRGLFNNFKIPIWYKYDHVLGKKEYLDIVEKMETLGFHVVSTSCDMARSNQKLAKSLGVTEETPYFPNPSRPASNIFWFYDICHLMKLVRNHLIDQGFILRGL